MLSLLDALYKLAVLSLLVFTLYILWPVLSLLVQVLNSVARWCGA